VSRLKPALLATAALLAPAAALAVTDADRLAVYHEFRNAFDAHRYDDALPLAQKLVALTEEQYSATDRALVNPLSNLGTTQYRMGDYKDAEDTYLRSVKIAGDTGGGAAADRLMLRPLQGLGVTYYATRQYEDASLTLQRAVDLSRNLDGLLNPGQLAILNPLIASLVYLERHGEADREFQYAVRVGENAWGANDARMVRPLDRYAHWLEHMGRYPTARVTYAREIKVAENAGGQAARLLVPPLLGVARTWRLEGLVGSEEESSYVDPFAQPTTAGMGLASANPRGLNPDGEKALLLALQTSEKVQPLDHALRGQALMELGDWYLCTDQTDKGLTRYREAWKEFQQSGSTTVMDVPRQLVYRVPSSAAARSPLAERDNDEHAVQATFTVTKEGKTANITTAGEDATPAQQKIVQTAVRRARYGPRMVNGEPVETPGVTLEEKLLSKKQKPPQS
jgi:tetratricopeptide (TPR) repeat protein